jgi:hypothetical protein
MLTSGEAAQFIDESPVPIASLKFHQASFTGCRERHGSHFLGACWPGGYSREPCQVDFVLLNLIDPRGTGILCQVNNRLQPVYLGCLSLDGSPLGW